MSFLSKNGWETFNVFSTKHSAVFSFQKLFLLIEENKLKIKLKNIFRGKYFLMFVVLMYLKIARWCCLKLARTTMYNYVQPCTTMYNHVQPCTFFLRVFTRVAQNSPIVSYQKVLPFLRFYGYSRWKSAKTLYTFETNLACSTHLKYTKEILKNTKEKSGKRIFQF